jgi:hypothetical protein
LARYRQPVIKCVGQHETAIVTKVYAAFSLTPQSFIAGSELDVRRIKPEDPA